MRILPMKFGQIRGKKCLRETRSSSGVVSLLNKEPRRLKALFYNLHGDPWGHSLLSLMQGLPEPVRGLVTVEWMR